MQTIFPFSDLANWVARIYEPGSRLILTEYAFPVDFGLIAAGGRATQNVQMTQNADFVLTSLAVLPAVGAQSDLRISITDTSTGEQFSNQQIPLTAIGSFSNDINRALPYPRWFQGISTVTLDVNSASEQTSLNISLCGFQIRKLS